MGAIVLITLNMIVKNEADTLPICLKGLVDFVSQILIVDTGSDDETIEIAKTFGAKIKHFAWQQDFAQARNFALQFVKTPWTLWLDADDLMLNPEGLIPLVQQAHQAGVSGLWCHYLQDAACQQRRMSLFRTRRFVWQGVVHEGLVAKNSEKPIETALCDLQIQHRKPKNRCLADAQKYLQILQEKDPQNWLGLAESYKLLAALSGDQKDSLKAYDAYFQALNHPEINEGTRYLCFFHLARLALEEAIHRLDAEALNAALKWAELGTVWSPHRAECFVLWGQSLQLSGQTKQALACFQNAMSLTVPLDETGCVFPGYYDAIPQVFLADLELSS